MQRIVFTLALLLAVGQVLSLPPSFAQQVKLAGKRKVVTQVKAVYPPLARKMNLTGIVRVVAIVAPDGTVVRTEVLGGSPVLVQSAVDAIAKSKWQLGPQESKEVIEIKFEPEAE
jgi:outer membrane biosynthesis protein TonB